MNPFRTLASRIVGFLFLALPVTGFGQEPASQPADDPVGQLRAVIEPQRTLYAPTQPVWVRFLLLNPTEQTIEVPGVCVANADGGLTLPQEFVFGPAGGSTVQLLITNERPADLRPAATTTAPSGTPLKLAPRSSLGLDVDLRPLSKDFRYTSKYKLEWKPLGGKIPAATAELRIEERMQARLNTDYGSITFTLFYDKAPRNVENFLELVRDQFYDEKTIHRVIPGNFMQGGSPTGLSNGIRPDGRMVPAEINDAKFEAGTLAMATKGNDPNSASCQFFVAFDKLPDLDGRYTIIGQARDEASLRTLRALSDIATHPNGSPIQALKIRKMTLAPEDKPTERTEIRNP